MKLFSSKRRIAAAVVLVLLVLFLLRPGASRLKSRIVSSISSAVGRPVEIGSVSLRLLPRPGFDLENLVVYDDPAFGAEPMLRASEVTAALRLTSLVRGRLEIARLDLTEPSLNLVHAEGGRWNLEALLERTAHMPLAPTGKTKSEPRPGFPYIAASSARINFKNGPEKKPYALTNADFALWQDSENSWGVRLKAQPVRTDLNLNDTGLLQVSGTWQRAGTLHDTPLQFSLEWTHAQLGQLTKFVTGNDQGWRGDVQLDVTVAGKPTNLQIAANASLQDFRRYDITSGNALLLAAHCDGHYSSLDHAFHELLCGAPLGGGLVTLKGDMGLPASHRYALIVKAESVPASALAVLAQRAKKNLPEDLVAEGMIQGSVSIQQNEATMSRLSIDGRGEISEIHLSSLSNKTEIGPEMIPFTLTAGDMAGSVRPRKMPPRKSGFHLRAPEGPHVEFGPFAVGAGRATTPTAAGWIDRGGYSISIAGDADISKSLRVARMFGVPSLQSTAEGTAQLNLEIMGSWAGRSRDGASGFSSPQVTGTAKLRNVHVAARGLGDPLEITSAEMDLSPDALRVGKLNAKAAGTAWTGSLDMPRGCGTPAACQVRFGLNTSQLVFSQLSDWLSPHPKDRPWYRVLESSGQSTPSFFSMLRASGRLTADRLQVQNFAATHVSADVSLDGGRLQISELNADFLGGKYQGDWQADFSGKPAVCSGKGRFTGVLLTRLAEVMKDPWISGTANGEYEVTASGSSAAEFWQSAEGPLNFDARDVVLPHLSLVKNEGPVRIAHFISHTRLQDGKLEWKETAVALSGANFLLNGTASLKRELALKLVRASSGSESGYSIAGTLAAPLVSSLPGAEQARLKTEPAK